MVAHVQIIGTKQFFATISKALVVSNIISVITFLGIGVIMMWQIKKGTKAIQADLKKQGEDEA